MIGVTGGAGYIGSTLLIDLVKQGHNAVSIDNQTIGDYKPLRKQAFLETELITGDIRNPELLQEKLRDCDAIAHLAAIPGLVMCNENPEEAVSTNIYGTYQVMEAARRLDIKRVVFCSSASTYGTPITLPVTEDHPQNPLNLYGVTKVTGEKILNTYHENYGLETVSLRFGNIYGVGLYTRWGTVIPKFVNQALSSEDITIYGDGEYSRDFVHVKDISKAIQLSLLTPSVGGEVFNVGGETYTINEIAEMVKTEVKQATDRTPSSTNYPPREGETKKFSYNMKKIRSILGFSNDWTVNNGIKQLIQYRINNKYPP